MKKIKLKSTIILIITLNIIITSITVYASNWLFKLDGKEILTINEFEEDYEAFIDFQTISQPFASEKEIKAAKANKSQKNVYLKNILNEILIVQDAKDRKIYNDSDLNKKVETIAKIIKRQFIKYIYLQKVVSSRVKKPDDSTVEFIYKQLDENKETSKWSSLKKKEYATQKAKLQELQTTFIKLVDELRSKHRIKLSDYAYNLD
ncbi:MAG: hypothetical protein OEV44_06345 [Spirochaetota bacterium]|nr:hypothetical protein [Spirochaetota bacterium]